LAAAASGVEVVNVSESIAVASSVAAAPNADGIAQLMKRHFRHTCRQTS